MYKLKKVVKESNSGRINKTWTFYKQDINLYDLDNRIPYGMDGGTDWNNTHFYLLGLNTYSFNHSWWNTENWCADLSVEFKLNKYRLNGTEEWETSFDQSRILSLVEESFQIYVDNILSHLDFEVKTDKNKKKFWSKDGYIFAIGDIEENLENVNNQQSELKILVANFWTNSAGKQVYYKDHQKTVGVVPKVFSTITKDEVKSIVRQRFLVIANRFLSQNFKDSIQVPAVSDLISMSREELLNAKDIFKNKTIFRNVIAK